MLMKRILKMKTMRRQAYQVDWHQFVEVYHCHSTLTHTTQYDPFAAPAAQQQNTQRSQEICPDHLHIIIIIIIVISSSSSSSIQTGGWTYRGTDLQISTDTGLSSTDAYN